MYFFFRKSIISSLFQIENAKIQNAENKKLTHFHEQTTENHEKKLIQLTICCNNS